MSELPTNANICIVNGPFYPVNLAWVPQVGDFIQLTSKIDMTAKEQVFNFRLKVVAIVHKMTDVTNKSDPISKGFHWVDVYAEKADIPNLGNHFEWIDVSDEDDGTESP